jgi:hypothetical protein
MTIEYTEWSTLRGDFAARAGGEGHAEIIRELRAGIEERDAVIAARENLLLTEPATLTLTHAAVPGGTAAFVYTSPHSGRLVLVSAEAAGAPYSDGDGDGVIFVEVNADPATNLGAVALYVDEDGAADETGLLLADITTQNTGRILYLSMSDGRCVPVKDVTTPGTPGRALKFDSSDGSLQFISPTTTDATVSTSPTFAAGYLLAAAL